MAFLFPAHNSNPEKSKNHKPSIQRHFHKFWIVFPIACLCMAYARWLQTHPNKLDILNLNDCVLPCWIGIIPGQTTIEEAQQIIQTRYEADGFRVEILEQGPYSMSNASLQVHDSARSRYLSIWLNDYSYGEYDNTPISDITLYIRSLDGDSYDPTVLELMDILGSPECLVAKWGHHTAWPTMLYPQYQTQISFSREDFKIEPNMRAGLVINGYANPLECHPSNTIPWRGFNIDYHDEFMVSMQP